MNTFETTNILSFAHFNYEIQESNQNQDPFNVNAINFPSLNLSLALQPGPANKEHVGPC